MQVLKDRPSLYEYWLMPKSGALIFIPAWRELVPLERRQWSLIVKQASHLVGPTEWLRFHIYTNFRAKSDSWFTPTTVALPRCNFSVNRNTRRPKMQCPRSLSQSLAKFKSCRRISACINPWDQQEKRGRCLKVIVNIQTSPTNKQGQTQLNSVSITHVVFLF